MMSKMSEKNLNVILVVITCNQDPILVIIYKFFVMDLLSTMYLR
jgi:hypothetical protein